MSKISADISVWEFMCPPAITFEKFMAGINRDDYDVSYVGCKNWSLHSVYSSDDERTVRLLNHLKALGMEPRPHTGKENPGMFKLWLLRKYEQADFDAAEFFEPDPISRVGTSVWRSEYGRLKLKKNHLRLRNFLGKADWPWLLVSDDMRKKIEKAELKPLVFHETEAQGQPLKDGRNQIWELDSSLELPPMSPKCDFRYLDGTPYTGDPNRECTLVEGFYNFPEFRYTRSAIESVGEFDLARTHEHWGTVEAPRKLVCSRRFYEFCQANKLKMNWIPVRIDPDEQ